MKKITSQKPTGNSGIPSKIGLRNPGGNIEDITSPAKRQIGFKKAISTTTKKDNSKKPTVKLLTYAQRRIQKKRNENSLNQSIDDLNVSSHFATNRTTLGMITDLHKLREARKANRAALVDDSREDVLFGSLESFQHDRNTYQEDSRNRVLNRLTVNGGEDFAATYNNVNTEELFSYKEESDQEEVYDDNIDEHDEGISPKRKNLQQHETVQKKQREVPSVLKRALLNQETGLEVIKETDDIAPSPCKKTEANNVPVSVVKMDLEEDENLVESEKEAAASPVKKIQSKLIRRHTVAPNLLSKLNEESGKINKIPKALERLKQDPEKSPTTPYTTSGVNTHNTFASKLKQTEQRFKKPENKLVSPSGGKFGSTMKIKSPMQQTLLKRPSTSKSIVSPNEDATPSQSSKVLDFSQTTKRRDSETRQKQRELEAKQKQEMEARRKLDAETRERKRKMMEERKMLLKKKLSAIKIQKYWKTKQRRRKLKLEHIRLMSAIRTIQKWFKKVYTTTKNKQQMLEL